MTPELRERLAHRLFYDDEDDWDALPEHWKKDALDNVDIIFSELTAAGYAVVPREPTEEMVEAAKATEGSKALDVICVFGHNHGHKLPHFETTPLIQMWEAMLAAEDQT